MRVARARNEVGPPDRKVKMQENESNTIEESDLFDAKRPSKGEKRKADHVVYGQVSNANPETYTDRMEQDELKAAIADKNQPVATRKVAVGRLGVIGFKAAMGTDEESISEALTRFFLKVYVQGKTATVSPEGISWED